jgi:hypothetical protein
VDRTELGPAREYATEHGLEPRGKREIGLEEFALYVYDPLRNGLFYLSSLSDIVAHVAANKDATKKRGRAQARMAGRRRLGVGS